jgi:peptide chain release factor subunit 3
MLAPAKVLKLGTPSNDATVKAEAPKVISIGSPAPKAESPKPAAKVESPKPEPPKVTEKKADSKPSSRSATPKPTKKAEEATKPEEKVNVEEDLEAVDDEVLEDLYGKEHLNVVFMGHVG